MAVPSLAPRFTPPYTAVIFTSTRTDGDNGYAAAAARMDELAAQQPGYLGIDSVRDPETGLGITVSYWVDERAARGWKAVTEHLHVQAEGRRNWYRDYTVRVAVVGRDYTARDHTPSPVETDLAGVRDRIDRLDEHLIELLAQRQGLVEQAGRLKRGQPTDAVRAPARAARITAARRKSAVAAGLEPDVAEAIWRAMIDAFTRHELDVHAGHSENALGS